MNPYVGFGVVLGALLVGGYLGYRVEKGVAEAQANAFYKGTIKTQNTTITQLRSQLIQRYNEEQTKVALLKDALKLEQDKSARLQGELQTAQAQYDDLQEEIARANLSHPADSSVLGSPEFERLYNAAARAGADDPAAAASAGR